MRNIRHIAFVSKLVPPFDLGDIVMSNAVVRYVRRQFPEARTTLIAREDEITRYRDRFYKRHSWIDEFLVCPALTERSWARWWRLYLQMRALKVDLCITSIQSLPACFVFLTGIPLRIGVPPQNRLVAKFLSHPIAIPANATTGIHWTDLAAAYVAALGGPKDFKVQNVVPYVRYEREETELTGNSLLRPIVVMHIGGAMHWNRRWPRESYLEICIRLSRQFNASIVLVCGEEERVEVAWLAARLKGLCPNACVEDLAGCSINRVLNVCSEADLYIGNDSGLMHLAVAIGLAAVVLFGPSDHRYLGPDKVDPRHRVMTKDFPCSRGFCQLGCSASYDSTAPDYPACMKTIDVEDVWSVIERKLSAGSINEPQH